MPEPGSERLTLAIEMSNPSMWAEPLISGEVAVGVQRSDQSKTLGVEPIKQDHPRDDALAKSIDRLLRRFDMQPNQLGRIAVSGGPGGFTSVRIAIATAKIMAEVIGAEVVVVPSGEVIARTFFKEASQTGDVAVLLAGKRDTAWCAVYRQSRWNDGPWPKAPLEGVLSGEGFAASPEITGVTALIADAHAPQGFHDWAQEAGVETLQPRLSAEALLIASCFHEPVDPVIAAPIYPREPEAVTKWRDLHGPTSDQ